MMDEVTRYMQEMNARYGPRLAQIPQQDWPRPPRPFTCPLVEVWRGRDFLVMIFADQGHERLSVVRTALEGYKPGHKRFKAAITWDDLQRLKGECGRGGRWAVEVFPPDPLVVNVQNMRHLWILPTRPPYGWGQEGMITPVGSDSPLLSDVKEGSYDAQGITGQSASPAHVHGGTLAEDARRRLG